MFRAILYCVSPGLVPSFIPFLSIQGLAPPQGIPFASLFWCQKFRIMQAFYIINFIIQFNFIAAGRLKFIIFLLLLYNC